MSKTSGNKILGERIRARRAEKGYTQESLADTLAVHEKTVFAWERGAGCMSDFIPALCEILDCDTEYLFGNSPMPHKETATAMDITGLSEKAVDSLISCKRVTVRPKDNDKIKALNTVIESSVGLHFLSVFYDYVFGNYKWVNLFGDDPGSSKITATEFQFEVFEKGTFSSEVYDSEGFIKMLRNSKMAKMQELLIKLRDETEGQVNSNG